MWEPVQQRHGQTHRATQHASFLSHLNTWLIRRRKIHTKTNTSITKADLFLKLILGANRLGLMVKVSWQVKWNAETYWEQAHTAGASEGAHIATHYKTHTGQHDADKGGGKKDQLTLWGNWIFIKYVWMSSSEWREASMTCRDWRRKKGESKKNHMDKMFQWEAEMEKETVIKHIYQSMSTAKD